MPEAQLASEEDLPRRWGLGDASLVLLMFGVSQYLGLFAASGVLRLIHADPKLAAHPFVLLTIELLGYVFAFLCARVIICLKTGRPFLESIEWKYPGGVRLPQLLLLGLLLYVAAALVQSFFSLPPSMPIERYFVTRATSIASMAFAMLVGPLAEEIYFRGIFFPALLWALQEERPRRGVAATLLVLAVLCAAGAFSGKAVGYAVLAAFLVLCGLALLRFNGDAAALLDEERAALLAIVLTGTFFGLVHAPQLAHAWAPTVIMIIVGTIFTAVRRRLDSVAASWILHTGYNGTAFLLMWAGTHGFTKLS